MLRVAAIEIEALIGGKEANLAKIAARVARNVNVENEVSFLGPACMTATWRRWLTRSPRARSSSRPTPPTRPRSPQGGVQAMFECQTAISEWAVSRR